jgi:FkbM family methyltransferase
MDIKGAIQRLIRRTGLDLHRYNCRLDPVWRRQRLLSNYGVHLVLDVGANEGQYVRLLRRGGYRGRIVSFEPQSAAFRRLEANADRDGKWTAINLALSDADATTQFNLAANSASSSLLGMLPTHADAAPESVYVGTETITARRLEGLFDDLAPPGTGIYMKVDTQGTELKVLEGTGSALGRIDSLELELSLVPLYEGGPLFAEMLEWLSSRGYELVGLEAGFSDPRTGRLLQVDGIFHRSGST